MNHLSKIKLAPEEPVTVAMAPLPLETHSLADPVEEKKRFFSSWKPFPWREALKSKNMLIGACVLLIVVAASTPPIDEANNDPSEENGDQNTNTNDESNYFAVAVINRERVRDEALDLLQTVAESEESTVEAREEAYTEMSRIASEITYEINIENLVRSKGFEECIAVINGNEINVVVKSDGLSMSEVAQIKEIVYLTSGILPDNIKIIEKQ